MAQESGSNRVRKVLSTMRSTRSLIWPGGALLALAILPAGPTPAAETGTLYCSVDDRHLSFDLLGNTGIEDGTIVRVQRGRLKLRPGRYVTNTVEFAVSKDDIFQQWDFAGELRFAIRLDDPQNDRKIVLAIITVRNEKLEKYLGRYVLQFVTTSTIRVLNGHVSCEGD